MHKTYSPIQIASRILDAVTGGHAAALEQLARATWSTEHPIFIRARQRQLPSRPQTGWVRRGGWAFSMLYTLALVAAVLTASPAFAAVDYSVLSVSMSTNKVAPGDNVKVTMVVKNIGSTAATKSSELVLRLVTEGARPISKTPQLASITISALAAGASVEKQVTVAVPSVPDGTRYFWAICDNTSVLGQASTAIDNDFGRSASITVATPVVKATAPVTTSTTPVVNTTPTTPVTTSTPATTTTQTPVVSTSTVPATPARLDITSSDFVALPGRTTTVRGKVVNAQGSGMANVDVAVSDALWSVCRIVGKTNALGEFTDSVSMPASATTGNYQLSYSAGGKTQNVVIVVANLQVRQFALPGSSLDFKAGAISGSSLDLSLYSNAYVANSTPAVYSGSILGEKGKRLLDAAASASYDELRKRAGDPATYVLAVSGVACAIPEITVAAAPACAVVFETLLSEAQVSAFRIVAHTAVKLSNLAASDKVVVDQIIDQVLAVRSAISLAASGSINRFDLYSQTWDASQTLIEIKKSADGSIEQVDMVGTGGNGAALRQLRLRPVTPVKPGQLSATTSATNAGTTTTPSNQTPVAAPVTPVTTAAPVQTAATTASTGVTTTSTPGTTSVPAVTTAPALQSRLAAISVRSVVGSNAGTLIAGVYITGNTTKRLLVRGIGPTLKSYGVSDAIADPLLKVYNSAGQQIGINDNWGGNTALTATFGSLGLFLLPSDSKDAALIVTLAPGSYSVQLTSTDNGTGTGLIEIYELP